MTSYPTSNFHLAASLVCAGYEIERLEPLGPRSCNILFEDSTEIRKTIDDYYSGKLMIPAIRHQQEQNSIAERSRLLQ